MRRKIHPLFMVLLALMAVGIVYNLWRYPSRLIIPIAVFAVVFLLYKYPPGRMKQARSRAMKPAADRTAKPKPKASHRRSVPFRVIEGGKDDDNLPKYH